MNRLTHQPAGIVLVLLIAAGVLFPGCVSRPPEDQAPVIPPETTMLMDFSDFKTNGAAEVSTDGLQPQAQTATRSNWGWAALKVLFWNTVITTTVAVPVGAYAESFNHEPMQLEDGTWVWAYDSTVAGVLYSAELQAKAVNGDIEWNMFISKEGEFSDVNWFSGVSNLVGTAGTWTLNMDPLDPKPFVLIEWHRNPTEGTSDIKYTNIIPDDPENGGYIFFAITDETPLDTEYDIFNKGQDNLTQIEWSRDTKAGHIRDLLRYDDEDWHCWNELFEDIDCSTAGF